MLRFFSIALAPAVAFLVARAADPAVPTNLPPVKTTVAPQKSTNVAPASAFVLRRMERVPPFVPPRFLAARFPRELPVTAVDAMVLCDGKLWLTVRPQGATNLPPGSGSIWVFDPVANTLEPVRGPLQKHAVNALHPGHRKLWLALDGGIASLDTQTLAVDAFGPSRGVTATDLVGFADVDSSVVAMARSGGLFGLAPNANDFTRASIPAPNLDPRVPPAWRLFAGSRDWMLAATGTRVVNRHVRASQWVPFGEVLGRGSPRLEKPDLVCAAGDGGGGFWLGSDAGLHWIDPDTGAVEDRFAPLEVTVPGGLGITIGPGYQASPAAYVQARARVMAGVRDRMRQRARFARASADARLTVSPVLPTSRIPGGVTALLVDTSFLWIATTDGANKDRARVLLFHMPSKKWIGWFPVGSPVRTLAADARHLWLGLDVSHAPTAIPLVAIDKTPLLAVPPARWTPDAFRSAEIGSKLAALPPKERAVHAFFSGDPTKVAEMLAPDGRPRADADAESLFLLAFAHDPVGLDKPEKLEAFASELRSRFPQSLFTEIINSVRPAAKPGPDPAPPKEAADETVADVLARRDLDGNGKLNAVELRLWRGPEADLKPFDQDGDGQLDAVEIAKLLRAR